MFIGINAIILMGTKIADNCIVGAGAVLSGNYPSNSVIVGNPAKVICSIEDFYKKRKQLYINEALNYYGLLKKKYGREPTITEMGGFFPLYLERDVHSLKKYRLRTNLSGDNEEEVIKDFLKSIPVFDSYAMFKGAFENANLDV